MSKTNQSRVKDNLLATPSETSKYGDKKFATTWFPCRSEWTRPKHQATWNIQERIRKIVNAKRVAEGIIQFGNKGKLAPRYVGPFEILERIGPVAYRLRLPEELSGVHDTFHVSNLKKCLADASLHVPLDEIKVDKTPLFC
ncbi:hypothetical protein Tco_0052366 [Tanacetum coccineum]